MMIKIEGTIQTQVKGLITQVNADAMTAAASTPTTAGSM